MRMVNHRDNCWEEAVATNGQSSCGAVFTAAARLVLWHWLQPALYYAVFLSYWAELDNWQRGFGSAVAVREALYALTVLAALCGNPAFLLVNIGASVRDEGDGDFTKKGYAFLALYVLAPEKVVAFAAFDQGGYDNDILFYALPLGGILLDLCGVAALVAGLLSPAGLIPALAVGYGATALGGLCFIVLWVHDFCC
jgi:hypothetical protein